MLRVDATPDRAAELYLRMEARLQDVRERLRRPLTLADKLVLGHLDPTWTGVPRQGETSLPLRADRVLLQDVLGQTALLQFAQTGRARTALPASIHCDHLIQARASAESDLRESLNENAEVYEFLRRGAARFGLGFWRPGAGIIHQVALEHYAFPGQLMLGTDSHTPMGGGLGALAIGVGGAEAVEAMAGLAWEVVYPGCIGVYLTGELQGWTAPKDVILEVAARLTVAGATNAIVEYLGPGARTLAATGKATIANMGAELGATTSVFGYDAHIRAYLEATGRSALARLADAHGALLTADPDVECAPDDFFDRVVRIDLSSLEPRVSGPHSPDRVRPLSSLASELRDDAGAIDVISTALIGSCTNSSYADMSRAAAVARQAREHGLTSVVPLMVTPGSDQIRATLARDGHLAALESIGATLLANACGPCIGQWRRSESDNARPNTIVTSYNRNFPARNDGRSHTLNYIASPEVVVALALAGRLSFNASTDSLLGSDGQPFRLAPPPAAPPLPEDGFASASAEYYIAPPEDGSDVALAVDPASERLQVLQPWPAWDGGDVVDVPVLMKARGKTTTDHIAPAGPWLSLRGHLERFSDALFLGVSNAFADAPGRGLNVLTGQPDAPLSSVARAYRAEGLRWIAIGDTNYGEGSSREHAALAPRLLGCAAIVARSFARIHESNLKKQGLLALCFEDPADYERVRADDRLSLLGLAHMAPAQPLECLVRHVEGTTERIWLRHSYTATQLDWFRHGSALNALRHASGAGMAVDAGRT